MRRLVSVLIVGTVLIIGLRLATASPVGLARWTTVYETATVGVTYPAALVGSMVDASARHQLTMTALIQGQSHLLSWGAWTTPSIHARAQTLQAPGSRPRQWTLLALLLATLLLIWRVWGPLTHASRQLRLSRSSGSAGWGGLYAWWRLHVRRREIPFVLGRIGPFGLGPRLGIRERDQSRNAILWGPPGFGKSRLIVDNILRLSPRHGDHLPSLTFTDSKGAIYAITAGHLARLGYRIVHIDWLNPDGDGYNPLDPCHVREVADAFAWADALTENTGRSTEAFWDETTTALLVGTVLTLLADQGSTTLQAVQRFLTQPKDVIKARLKHSNDPVARELAQGMLSNMAANERLEGSVFTSPPLKFMALWDARIVATSSHNSVEWADLADPTKPPTAVYITLPAGYELTLKPFVSTLFTQMNTELLRVANAQPGRKMLPRRVMCWWDEAGTIGRIADLPARLNTTREAGLGTVLGVQSTTQLDEIYGENGRKIILQGCYAHIILPGLRLEQAEMVATELGQATVAQQQGSATRQGDEVLFRDRSRALAETGRALLTADEVRRLWGMQCLLVLGNLRPVRLWWTGYWYRNPFLQKRANRERPAPMPPTTPVSPLPATGPTSPMLIDWSNLDG